MARLRIGVRDCLRRGEYARAVNEIANRALDVALNALCQLGLHHSEKRGQCCQNCGTARKRKAA